MKKLSAIIFCIVFSISIVEGQSEKSKKSLGCKSILPGAYQTKEYVPDLKGKRVAIFANNTSTIGKTHLVDTLRKLGINIIKIFGPEHGFRGTAGAGDKVDSYKDAATGISVISLYGKKIKPSKEDLADVDLLLFDIQDVGVRFYTYISSLQLLIESAVENNKPLIILDRPNPNGFYIDGPVLDTAFRSFVGMQPVPVVYGMTIGEYARFIVGERLLHKDVMALLMLRLAEEKLNDQDLSNGLNVKVIKCRNYKHSDRYTLPEKPSPNLPDESAVLWYPSICFFEGTVISEGRGTNKPFRIFGHPSLPKKMYTFTPTANAGAANPKLMNQTCYGWNVSALPGVEKDNPKLQLQYLLQAFQLFPEKEKFFLLPKKNMPPANEIFFNKLAGNATLMQQIKDGKSEAEIRATWQPKLEGFKKIRKKYLLYEDK